jgi:hypothetical protein
VTPKPPRLISVGAAILGLLGGAAPSGLLVPSAEALTGPSNWRRRDEEDERGELLLVAPPDGARILLAGHRSHRSHSSHRSHYSGRGHYSGGGGGSYRGSSTPEPDYVPPPSPPKPANVSFVAYPGGRIFVDGKAVGQDITSRQKLAAGKHEVRVENRFLGTITVEVDLTEGQTGEVKIEW